MAKPKQTLPVIPSIEGWLLIAPDDDVDWNIAWMDPFSSKKEALAFAVGNSWPKPYKAVRGRLMVDPA